MNKTKLLADRLREVILDGTWIANTNYRDQLEQTELSTANQKIGTLNTIAALAQHTHYYIAGITQVFTEGKLEIRDKFSFDFAPLETEDAWRIFQQKFWQDTDVLVEFIRAMPDDQLDDVFVDEKYGTYYRNIDGMIEHSYYHLGQIVMLRKLISEREDRSQ